MIFPTLFKMSTFCRQTSLRSVAEVFHSVISGFLRQGRLDCSMSFNSTILVLAMAADIILPSPGFPYQKISIIYQLRSSPLSVNLF